MFIILKGWKNIHQPWGDNLVTHFTVLNYHIGKVDDGVVLSHNKFYLHCAVYSSADKLVNYR